MVSLLDSFSQLSEKYQGTVTNNRPKKNPIKEFTTIVLHLHLTHLGKLENQHPNAAIGMRTLRHVVPGIQQRY
jgi:hypothetical protein